MITPEQLESYGYGNEEIFAGLEQRIMDDIVRRIKDAGVITRSADFQINELRRLGFSNADIKSMLQDALDASDAYIDELYQTTIETDYISNKQLYDALDKRFIPFKQNTWLQNMISAAKNQTKEEMHNLSQSLGFVIRTGDGSKNMSLSEYFKNVIDQVIVDIQTGGFDYNTTLRKAVKQMSNSGIRWINYDTGWHNRITVAARRSVMTAISQMSVSISDDTAKKLGIDTFEISAHANPRPTHAVWQGTIKTKLQLIEECGLGSVTGLLGANCYHVYYPFVKGVSKRAYTDEQLRKWSDPTPKTYKGKEYTGYEAKQRMRQMETNMRAMREEIRMLQEGGGDLEDILNAQVRYRTAMYEYGDFAKKMGMKQQKERIYMDGLGNVLANAKESVKMITGARITDPDSIEGIEFAEMYYEEIRSFSTDCKRIAKNINKSEADIRRIKAYLFEDLSYLDPKTQTRKRFYPDCAIAQSWQRLMIGQDIKPHDITMIEHELLEMKIKKDNPSITHQEAHDLANEKYNYGKGAKEYYGNLKKHNKNKR